MVELEQQIFRLLPSIVRLRVSIRKDFDELDRRYVPWRLWARLYVDERAPEDIRRIIGYCDVPT
jgi:hypothetical protein